ncbi:Mut7-C RNAse domain-containing protein [Candidatus Nitrosocosmicus hydrocola]|uniref:Mut7-C RNAse domain-containing protein n=1 Tax=Candidatus Nitrosocosmicus hydrocola TaxID=1826872 RepID=UPI00137245FA
MLRCCEINYIDWFPNSCSRCTICNELLNTKIKILVIREIPHNVFEHIDVVYRCTSRMKVDWNGRISGTLTA